MNSRQSQLCLFIPILIVSLCGCEKTTHLSTQAAGHDIRADIKGAHSVKSGAERGVIEGQYGKVTIEPRRVQIGEGPWNKIPEHASVHVKISKGRLMVSTGAVTVTQTF